MPHSFYFIKKDTAKSRKLTQKPVFPVQKNTQLLTATVYSGSFITGQNKGFGDFLSYMTEIWSPTIRIPLPRPFSKFSLLSTLTATTRPL